MINGADKHALSSLLLRLPQLGHIFNSCLLSRHKKTRSSGAKKTAVLVPVSFGKNRSFNFKNRNSPSKPFAVRMLRVSRSLTQRVTGQSYFPVKWTVTPVPRGSLGEGLNVTIELALKQCKVPTYFFFFSYACHLP